ncbi:S24 family peptidase [Hymenobacter metallicola]|uniref:S24 family peptidase n=1 Tax=Hymenobacter metallicola TaxID=2563114 RepID=UPI001F106037|nr:S24 family peptidase [Hymenobacter metallicola]
MFVDTSLQELLELPFIIPSAYGSFTNSCHDRNYGDFDTVRIVKQPGVDYTGAVVLEVRGNSMAPRYPERSCHVVRPVSDGNWQHALGVHAIALRSEMFIIKRIVNNVNGILRLKSDNNGDEMEITLGDINCMWKVGEATFMPAED